jgi:mono/diheme cytochrome c family protein
MRFAIIIFLQKIKYLIKTLKTLKMRRISMKGIFIPLALICIFLLANAMKSDNEGVEKWVAPKSADNLENPLKGDEAATKSGKKLYKQFCSICHGDKGKGDGMAGLSLMPKPANFTTEAIQAQSDGALFWKMTEGRAPMASYRETLKENQRWQLVNYIRTFKK